MLWIGTRSIHCGIQLAFQIGDFEQGCHLSLAGKQILEWFDAIGRDSRTGRRELEYQEVDILEQAQDVDNICSLQVFEHDQFRPLVFQELSHSAQDRIFVSFDVDLHRTDRWHRVVLQERSKVVRRTVIVGIDVVIPSTVRLQEPTFPACSNSTVPTVSERA